MKLHILQIISTLVSLNEKQYNNLIFNEGKTMNNLVSNTKFKTVQHALTVAELKKRASDLLPEFGKESAQREIRRQLPFEQIRQLAEARLLTFRIPEIYGGSQSSIKEVIK